MAQEKNAKSVWDWLLDWWLEHGYRVVRNGQYLDNMARLESCVSQSRFNIAKTQKLEWQVQSLTAAISTLENTLSEESARGSQRDVAMNDISEAYSRQLIRLADALSDVASLKSALQQSQQQCSGLVEFRQKLVDLLSQRSG